MLTNLSASNSEEPRLRVAQIENLVSRLLELLRQEFSVYDKSEAVKLRKAHKSANAPTYSLSRAVLRLFTCIISIKEVQDQFMHENESIDCLIKLLFSDMIDEISDTLQVDFLVE